MAEIQMTQKTVPKDIVGYCSKAALLGAILCSSACGIIEPQSPEERIPIPGVNSPPLNHDQAEELLDDMGEGWLYGEGLGDTALQVGTVVMFPPYALVLLGNGALSLSGYKPVTVSGLLPEEAGKVWKEGYSGVVSVPGRVTAAAVGAEFRTPERIKADLQKYIVQPPPAVAAENSEEEARAQFRGR